jgi:hypothetical protein
VEIGGVQAAVVEETIRTFQQKVQPARISAEFSKYLLDAVLLPRILYPLVVIPLDGQQIDKLESKTMMWALKKLGVRGTYARDLCHAGKWRGGLGMEPWRLSVLKARRRLALLMSTHEEVYVRHIWEGMRLREFESGASGRLTLGGKLGDRDTVVEAQGGKGRGGGELISHTPWIGAYDHMLRQGGVEWDDGWRPIPMKEGDVHINTLVRRAATGWGARRQS